MGAQSFTVYDMLARGAALSRDAPALIQGPRQWSFRQLLERADALAAGLASLGLAKGDRICILAQNDVAYVDLYGACARQGIVAYPINWRLTAQEVERVVERAAPTMMVADASTLPVVGEWPRTRHAITHWYQFGGAAASGFRALSSLYREGVPPAAADVSSDDPLAVISTAAVDVIPRGAVLTHANVLTASLVVVAALGFTAADRYLLALPLFHITALGNLVAHMHAGGASVVVARFDAEEAVRLIDTYDRDVPVGTPGEILVRGPVVFQGYFGQPDVTAHTLRNGWHHTGDVGRFDDEGWLYYVRRKPEKELIKPGGENVYPAEVESVIVQMDGVSAVCVYGVPDVKWGEAIKAVVEVRPADRYTARQVGDFVASKIARFKRPHAVAFTDALPRTADGAVDREAVKARWGADPA